MKIGREIGANLVQNRRNRGKNAGNCRKLQLAEGKIESTHPNFAQAELPSTEVRKKRAYAGRMGAAK